MNEGAESQSIPERGAEVGDADPGVAVTLPGAPLLEGPGGGHHCTAGGHCRVTS